MAPVGAVIYLSYTGIYAVSCLLVQRHYFPNATPQPIRLPSTTAVPAVDVYSTFFAGPTSWVDKTHKTGLPGNSLASKDHSFSSHSRKSLLKISSKKLSNSQKVSTFSPSHSSASPVTEYFNNTIQDGKMESLLYFPSYHLQNKVPKFQETSKSLSSFTNKIRQMKSLHERGNYSGFLLHTNKNKRSIRHSLIDFPRLGKKTEKQMERLLLHNQNHLKTSCIDSTLKPCRFHRKRRAHMRKKGFRRRTRTGKRQNDRTAPGQASNDVAYSDYKATDKHTSDFLKQKNTYNTLASEPTISLPKSETKLEEELSLIGYNHIKDGEGQTGPSESEAYFQQPKQTKDRNQLLEPTFDGDLSNINSSTKDNEDTATITVVEISSKWCSATYSKYVKQLRKLNCTGVQFSDVPLNVQLFVPHVESMRLSRSNFMRFSEVVVKSSKIRVLNLYLEDSNVGDVKDVFDIFDSQFLLTLKLRNNTVAKLNPDTFSQATNLEILDLSRNFIRNVSGSLTGTTSLKHLFLRDNQLTHLTENMFLGNQQLQELYLDNNNIIRIDQRAFNGLEELMTLDLSSNYLANEPSVNLGIFSPCVRLQTLLLRNCNISTVTNETFRGLKNLHRLDIPGNSLSFIPEGTFKELTLLTSLNLENNKLLSLSRTWSLPPALTILSLYNNEISKIENGVFDGIDLSVIFLNSNKLKTLPTMVQLYLTTRNNVTLSHNPWRCDCDLVFLMHHVLNSPFRYTSTKCAWPRETLMSDISVQEIKCPAPKGCIGSQCRMCHGALQRRVDDTCVCMEGTVFTNDIGKAGCSPCPAHTYKPSPSNGFCQPCSHGSMPISGPAPVCSCAAGYRTNEKGDCEKCPSGTFKNYVGVGICSRCVPGISPTQQCPIANHDPGKVLNLSSTSQDNNVAVSSPEESNANEWLIVVAASVLFVACALIVILVFGHHYRAKRRLIKRYSAKMNTRKSILQAPVEETQFSNGSSSNSVEFRCNSVEFRCSSRHSLRIKDIGNMIGRGAFGQVYEAFAYLKSHDREPIKVAIKRLKDSATDEEIKNLKEELEQMLNVGPHPNIIGVYGSTFYEGHLCIVMEYAELGDLLSYLKTECTFPLQYVSVGSDGLVVEQSAPQVEDNANLMMFAWQIAKGMRHLEMHRYIHRDLAARNCLLTKGPIAKVSDFGLSKDAYELGHYKRVQKDRVPFKWLSPEALLWGQYSSKSDVWAYGILLWELYTFGGTPYPQVTTEQLRELHEHGYRMSKPPACPEQLYRIIRACWREDPRQRPSFKQLEHTLDSLIQQTKEREYLDLHPHGLKSSIPLPLITEDMDDKKTSVDFVLRSSKQASYCQNRHPLQSCSVHKITTDPSIHYSFGEMPCNETFPMLADANSKMKRKFSKDSTETSGFQSMTSAQTM